MFLQDLLVGPDSFSLGELAHAIVIMTHYHALASFALGCGVNPEIDTPQGHCYEDLSQIQMNCYQGNPALGVIGTTSDSEVTDSDVGFSPITSPAHPVTKSDKFFERKLRHLCDRINHVMQKSPIFQLCSNFALS